MTLGLASARSSYFRRTVSLLCIATLGLQTACYSYAPLQTASPTEPREIGVVINDRGRALLGERVGALVDRIDGQIVTLDSQNIVMIVHQVTDLRGTSSAWTGERVSIPREAVLGFRERKLSKFKILALIGVAALAVVAIFSASLDVFGDGKTDGPPLPPSDS